MSRGPGSRLRKRYWDENERNDIKESTAGILKAAIVEEFILRFASWATTQPSFSLQSSTLMKLLILDALNLKDVSSISQRRIKVRLLLLPNKIFDSILICSLGEDEKLDMVRMNVVSLILG
jgi:hypothetical protein